MDLTSLWGISGSGIQFPKRYKLIGRNRNKKDFQPRKELVFIISSHLYFLNSLGSWEAELVSSPHQWFSNKCCIFLWMPLLFFKLFFSRQQKEKHCSSKVLCKWYLILLHEFISLLDIQGHWKYLPKLQVKSNFLISLIPQFTKKIR